MGKWEWECSVGMGMGGNGNKNDSMRVGREWEQESYSRTPLNVTCFFKTDDLF